MSTAIYDQVQILPTKECRVCDQLIDLTAVCCPFCQASQPKQPSLTRSAFTTLLIASAAITLGVIGYWVDNRDLSNRDMSKKDINAPIAVSKDPAPTPNVDNGKDATPTIESRRLAIDIEQTISRTRELSTHLPQWPPGLTAEHSPLDLMELSPRGVATMDCSAAREFLLKLVGATDKKSAREFNAVYVNSRSCRPYTSW